MGRQRRLPRTRPAVCPLVTAFVCIIILLTCRRVVVLIVGIGRHRTLCRNSLTVLRDHCSSRPDSDIATLSRIGGVNAALITTFSTAQITKRSIVQSKLAVGRRGRQHARPVGGELAPHREVVRAVDVRASRYDSAPASSLQERGWRCGVDGHARQHLVLDRLRRRFSDAIASGRRR